MRNKKFITSTTYDSSLLGKGLKSPAPVQPTFCPGGGFTADHLEQILNGTKQAPAFTTSRSPIEFANDIEHPVNQFDPSILNGGLFSEPPVQQAPPSSPDDNPES